MDYALLDLMHLMTYILWAHRNSANPSPSLLKKIVLSLPSLRFVPFANATTLTAADTRRSSDIANSAVYTVNAQCSWCV
jgi:hypothetical protein